MLRAVVDCSKREQRRQGKARHQWMTGVRQTTSDDDDAERRRCLALKSADWQSSSARYDSKHKFVYKASKLEVNSLRRHLS